MNFHDNSISTTSGKLDNSTGEQPKIKNVIKEKIIKDHKIMLSCILYEVVQGKSVENSYECFCKVLGDDAMEYTDFDYWYYRFVNGELDLDHDRSLDRRRPELSDMPLEVAERIVGKLEWKDRCAVRKVSRNFRCLIDCSKQHFDRIHLNAYSVTAKLEIKQSLSRHCVSYKFKSSSHTVCINGQPEKKFDEKKEAWKPVLNDLLLILRNPKVEIDELSFGPIYGDCKEFRRISDFLTDSLSTFKHKIRVKSLKFEVKGRDGVLTILPFLKPGVLEEITFSNIISGFANIDALVDLDQWKQAKRLEARGVECSAENLKGLYNSTEFSVIVPSITANDVLELKKALIASPNFKSGLLECRGRFDFQRLQAELGMESNAIEDKLRIGFFFDYMNFNKLS